MPPASCFSLSFCPSYLEIYNEKLIDLLSGSEGPLLATPSGTPSPFASPEKPSGSIRIVEDHELGPVVRGITECVVSTPQQALELVAFGERLVRLDLSATVQSSTPACSR